MDTPQLAIKNTNPFTFWTEIYTWSAPNNSKETYPFMCLGRTGHFWQNRPFLAEQAIFGSAKTALKSKYENQIA